MKAKTDRIKVESCRLSVCHHILYIRSGSPQLTNMASYNALSDRWFRTNINVEGDVPKRAHVQDQRPTNAPAKIGKCQGTVSWSRGRGVQETLYDISHEREGYGETQTRIHQVLTKVDRSAIGSMQDVEMKPMKVFC